MKVNADVFKIMRAGKCGCGIRKQNESGVVLGIALLLAAMVLAMGVMTAIHTQHHLKAVNADLDLLEARSTGGK